ncbi:alpha/beta hydrolase [Sphingopyxis bauzanensis]|uniref:Alpha/beta hydrolase n=1 Tax=Sphingopyxis bauzanensis TaxID=651663 RepID=A0A246K062_9SPHN|nr:alpha/beta hydrolase [Sphingopyxis bauzanensis]OWQ98828.1 alpha/beta hydrolase [Sphingopyxis bauzanensis]GGJ59684.1 arylesterase [Sphingopyxis bauzanensis]
MKRRDVFSTVLAGGAALALAGTPARAAPRAAANPAWVTAADGTRLYVRIWGAGAPILFLSGWALSSEMWAYQMAALSERGLRCIAYDRRGHGRSDDPGAGYDYATLAGDLDAILTALDVKGATVVAHSMSGGEILSYLAKQPAAKRVARILFLATTLPCLTAKPDNPAGVPAGAFDQMRRQFYTDFPQWIDANSDAFVVPETSPLMRGWIKNIMLRTSLRAIIDLNRAMTAADFRDILSAVTLPTLFIHGDKDASAPLALTAQPASQLPKRSSLNVYEGAPHGLFATHIGRLNADIEAFARG